MPPGKRYEVVARDRPAREKVIEGRLDRLIDEASQTARLTIST